MEPDPRGLPTRLDAARRILNRCFGYPDFRPAQRRVIQSVLARRDTLAVLPTGAGKSLCFQIPAMVEGGLTVVVSPLISLMQDQVQAALSHGIPAAVLNSSQDSREQRQVLAAVRREALRLVYISPERIDRLTRELARMRVAPRLLAVDEAHCISEWGHDFRPSFRALRRARYRLGQPPTVALTGSATPRVRGDIALSLGFRVGPRRFDLHVASFDRPNLWFGVRKVKSDRERLSRLIAMLRDVEQTAIVYAPTRNMVEGITRGLIRSGFRTEAYHAGLPTEQRSQTLGRFLDDGIQVVVATSAFGMGIDKPSVRLVAHWIMPPTIESYYQEAGRAGRDGNPARCVLFHRKGDGQLHRRQLSVTFPDERVVEAVWRHPERRARVAKNVLAAADRLRRELGPDRAGNRVDWRPVRRRRRQALGRIRAIERYAATIGCRRARLLEYFGERPKGCAGCDRCAVLGWRTGGRRL